MILPHGLSRTGGEPCCVRGTAQWSYDALPKAACNISFSKKEVFILKMSGKEAYSLMLKNYPDIMNIDDMCTALNISTKTGYKLLKEGKISAMKVGRTYRIPKIHVLAYLRIVEHAPTV